MSRNGLKHEKYNYVKKRFFSDTKIITFINYSGCIIIKVIEYKLKIKYQDIIITIYKVYYIIQKFLWIRSIF